MIRVNISNDIFKRHNMNLSIDNAYDTIVFVCSKNCSLYVFVKINCIHYYSFIISIIYPLRVARAPRRGRGDGDDDGLGLEDGGGRLSDDDDADLDLDLAALGLLDDDDDDDVFSCGVIADTKSPSLLLAVTIVGVVSVFFNS